MKENLFEMYARMCESYRDCRDGCGLHEEGMLLKLSCRTFITEYPDKAKEIVEKWAEENPIVFLEMYPNAGLDEDGVLNVYSCDIDKRIICCINCKKLQKRILGRGGKVMDSVKFLEEASRICRQVGNCINCPLVDGLVDDNVECRINLKRTLDHEEIEDCVKIVEEWSKNNPKKTRAEALKRLFPNNSVESLCIQLFDTSIETCEGNCPECIEKFWHEEVEGEGETK